MADTNRLVLPLLAASQAQKHVTVNEALKLLDAIVQAGVIDKDLTAPPGSPSEGDIYIVGASATGDWASQDDDLAIYQDGAWVFVTPLDGFTAFVADESTLYVYDSGWTSLAGLLGAGYLPITGGTLTGDLALEEASPSIRFGDTDISGDTLIQTNGVNFQISVDYDDVDASSTFQVLIDGSTKAEVNEYGLGVGGTSADANNVLAVYGTNALFNSGGSFSFKFNKNAAANDASVAFQTSFTSHALMGLLGDNDFTLKVGSSLTTALVFDGSTGRVSSGAAIQASTDDSTSGVILLNGAHGLGTRGSAALDDVDAITNPTGWYNIVGSGTSNNSSLPSDMGGSSGNKFGQMRIEAYSSSRIKQTVFSTVANDVGVWTRWYRSSGWESWSKDWNTRNTTVDGSGFILEASPVLRVYHDSHTEPVVPVGASFSHIERGVYRLDNVGPLSPRGWQFQIPRDVNGNPVVALGDTAYSDASLTINIGEPVWSEGKLVPGSPLDIPEGHFLMVRLDPDYYKEEE